MAKARLSQVTSNWVYKDEKGKSRNKKVNNKYRNKQSVLKKFRNKDVELSKAPYYKVVQTVRLRPETLKRLWMNRAMTGKTLSATIDELVMKYIRA